MKNKKSTLAIVQRTSGGNSRDRHIRRQHFPLLAMTTTPAQRAVEAEVQHVESPERTPVERLSGLPSAEQAALCDRLDPTGSWHDAIRTLDPIVLDLATELTPAEKTIQVEVQRVEPYRGAEWNPYNEGYEDYKFRIANDSQAAKILAPHSSLPVRIVSSIWRGVKWLFGGTPIDYGPDRPYDGCKY